MPYRIAKKGSKWRVIERDSGEVAKNNAGTAVDGGGHATRGEATAQMQALNIAYMREKGVKRKGRKVR